MKYLRTLGEIGFICALSILGQVVSSFFHLPLPGNLVGMFLLILLLFSGVIKESQIQMGADLLLKYMSLFFIPAGVGLLAHWNIIEQQWLPWLVTVLLSTALILILTGKLVDYWIQKEEGL